MLRRSPLLAEGPGIPLRPCARVERLEVVVVVRGVGQIVDLRAAPGGVLRQIREVLRWCHRRRLLRGVVGFDDEFGHVSPRLDQRNFHCAY